MAPQINDFFDKLKKTESNNSKLNRIKGSKLISKNSLNINTEKVISELVNNVPLNEVKNSIDNQETNRRQIGDKSKTQYETNLRQTEDKLETNRRQTGDKQETKCETKNEIGDKPESQPETNRRQIGDKNEIMLQKNTLFVMSPTPFSSLVGLQKKITLYIYEICKQTRSIITPALSLEFIANQCKNNALSVKKSLQRLEIKYVILRKEYKAGRGGWSKYSLNEITVQEILQYGYVDYMEKNISEKNANRRQTGDKLESQPETKPETTVSSSSSYIYNKTTTTEKENELDVKWRYIDYSQLSEYGFNEKHIKQLSRLDICDPQIIQDSIYHFAFDLRYNDKRSKIKGDLINYIMGILSKGGPYVASANYMSSHEQDLKSYHEHKLQEEKRKNELYEKIEDQEFELWYQGLSNKDFDEILSDEIENLKSPHMPQSVKDARKIKILKNHFKQFVWPEIKRKTLCKD